MAESIARLKLESGEFDSKIQRAAKGLLQMERECRNVGGTLAILEKDQRQFVQALGSMQTVSNTTRGKLAELTAAYTDLSVQYKRLTDEEKNGDYGQALRASLDQLKTRISDTKGQLQDVSSELNGGLSNALNGIAGKFGLSIDQVTKFGSVVGVATTAIQVAKDAFFQSESNIDEWGRTIEGAKGAYSVFLDTLNNGNWSNFFQNLQTAIQGGRDLYDVFDRLGSIKSNNAAAIAITQKEIAELRLAKQQGENVDAKLKSATERLAALQKQSVSAGMAAGSTSAFQTIRNGVNSVGGAGVNDATIKYAVDRIMKYGQAEFDRYSKTYQTLQQRGMVTRSQTIYDSQGGTYERQYREFDINALTKEQQKQYALSKAITEGETRIQSGIATYAQAVSEGAASAREEFKGNRYALQGGGGGGHSGGGSSRDINAIIAQQWDKASLKASSDAGSFKAEELEGGSEAWNTMREAITGCSDAMADYSAETATWTKAFDPYAEKMAEMSTLAKQQQMAFDLAAQGANSLGQALAGLDDPAARAAGTVISAIANIALGFAQASVQASSMGPWGWVAFLAAGAAAMATTISTVHSLTGYAEGGIIPGNSYSGDNQLAMVNAGELILSKSQQTNLANSLESNGGGMMMQPYVDGEKVFLGMNNHTKRSGKGEIVTTSTLRRMGLM